MATFYHLSVFFLISQIISVFTDACHYADVTEIVEGLYQITHVSANTFFKKGSLLRYCI